MTGPLIHQSDAKGMLLLFLRGQDELTGIVDPSNVRTMLKPDGKTWPVLKLDRVGGSADPQTYWDGEAIIQLTAWAWLQGETPTPVQSTGPQLAAFRIIETALAAITQRLVGRQPVRGEEEVVVTAVRLGGITEDLDDSFAAARHRARSEVVIVSHPVR